MTKRKQPLASNNPDHSSQLLGLNRVLGQISGIKRMIEEKRYCPEIIQQIRATRKALTTIEASLLEKHLTECVAQAFREESDSNLKKKIEEIMRIFRSGEEHGIELKSK